MKNKHYQRKVAAAKAYMKKRGTSGRDALQDGVQVLHAYSVPYRFETWWDDFGFQLGSQWVMVWWVHPRMKFTDVAQDMAYERAKAAIGEYNGDLFGDSKPIYAKRGKSRKKVVAYESTRGVTPSWQDFSGRWDSEKKALIRGDELSVGLNLDVEQLGWCRGIELTYPVELRNEADIITFAKRVRQHLRGEINLFEGLENYQYTAADFRAEFPNEEDWRC